MYQALYIHNIIARHILNVDKFRGTIHSIFHKAINLKLEEGDMLSLLVSRIDKSPTSIILNLDSFTPFNAKVGDEFYIEDKKLIVGLEEISLDHAFKYELKLPNIDKKSRFLEDNLSIAHEYMDSLIKNVNNPMELLIFRKLKESANNLKLGLEIGLIFKSLIGMGIGLTPSGDDFLVGFMSVAFLEVSGMENFKAAFESLIFEARSLTNEISYSVLKNASRGYFKQIYSDFIDSFFTSTIRDEDFEAILKMGYSSGRDTLLGIITGLEIFRNMNSQLVITN